MQAGLDAQVLWNGHVAATLPALDTGFVSLALPALHAGHHSIFVKLLCSDASCPHPVNGSVFFSATAAPASPAQGDARAPETRASDAVDAEIAAEIAVFECTDDDLAAFLPHNPRRATPEKSAAPVASTGGPAACAGRQHGRTCSHGRPTKDKMCRALAALHGHLLRDVQQRPRDAQAWAALGRFFMSRRRVPAAVSLYRAALRRSRDGDSGSGPEKGADWDLWRVDTCSHLHQALHMAASLRAVGHPAHTPEGPSAPPGPAHALTPQAFEHALLSHLRLYFPSDTVGPGDAQRQQELDAQRQQELHAHAASLQDGHSNRDHGGEGLVEGGSVGGTAASGPRLGDWLQEEDGSETAVSEEEVVFGVVSGRSMYETRARAGRLVVAVLCCARCRRMLASAVVGVCSRRVQWACFFRVLSACAAPQSCVSWRHCCICSQLPFCCSAS